MVVTEVLSATIIALFFKTVEKAEQMCMNTVRNT
jgi:hypothetical protein